MTLTHLEQQFLGRQPLARLATVGMDGGPQVKPVGCSYNSVLGTIDITGFNMAASAKYRNVEANPKVALVVDEVTASTMEGAHFLEVRGLAEVATDPALAGGHLAPEIIRIRPRRVISFNIDPAHPGFASRDVEDSGHDSEVA